MSAANDTALQEAGDKPKVVPAFLLNDPSLGCPFCGAINVLDSLSEHKKQCSKYQEMHNHFFSNREVEGDSSTKKRGCPIITEMDDTSGSSASGAEDKENELHFCFSPRKKKLTKPIPVARVRTPQDVNPTGTPFLHVPDVGKGSAPDLLLGGWCPCCGKYQCKFLKFTIFDLVPDWDNNFSDYDPDGTLLSDSPLHHYCKCDMTSDQRELGMAVRRAVYCLVQSSEMFSNHKFIGDPAFEAKLRQYFSVHLSHPLVQKYWIPLRIASKVVVRFQRMASVDAIRDKVLGRCKSPSTHDLPLCHLSFLVVLTVFLLSLQKRHGEYVQ